MNSIAVAVLLIIGISAVGRPTLHEVHMSSMRFLPANIVIKKGDKVRWVNDSAMIHNVFFSNEKKSSWLKRGDTYELQFDSAGKFNYFCVPHKSMGMIGSVTVND